MIPTVLLIDGDEPSLKLARLLLEDRGWIVVAARSVREAIVLLRSVQPHLIATELFCPTPFDAIRTIRAVAKHTPIVAVSGRNGPETELAALAAGCIHFLRKPIDIDTFAAHLEPLFGAP